jgi:putative DNA primase/helicase
MLYIVEKSLQKLSPTFSPDQLRIAPNYHVKRINPTFEGLSNPEVLINHVRGLVKKDTPVRHDEILCKLLEQFEPLDFIALVFPQVKDLRKQLQSLSQDSEQSKDILKELSKLKINNKHFLVLSIENVRIIAERNNWGLCKNQEFVYLYNGAYWTHLEGDAFQKFLGEAAEKMGVPKFTARHYKFREELLKQFLATEYLPTPEAPVEKVLINLNNGTFEVTPKGTILRQFNKQDFLTYQLPFKYSPEDQAPMFNRYLNKVLPDTERQNVLAEFLGFVFIKHGSNSIKEEKALTLYGTGANGKSVFFEIVNALLGKENVSTYSIQSLTDSNGYYRAMIANKLVNYASEVSGNLETSVFKQLVSGEPVEARLPYGKPMLIRQYSKLIFNSNELPKDVEHTNAYFRRFLIIPFDVTIPEDEQDKQLHSKIIDNELSGVFNWVLDGLNRLLVQKRFSHCDAAMQALDLNKIQSDSVKLFINENGYRNSPNDFKLIKELYMDYRSFCSEDGFKPVNKSNFIKRLQSFGVVTERKNNGNVAYLLKSSEPF